MDTSSYEQLYRDIEELVNTMSDVRDRLSALQSRCSYQSEQLHERLLCLTLTRIRALYDQAYMAMYDLDSTL